MTLSVTAVAIIVSGISDNAKGRIVPVKRIMGIWAIGAAASGAYGILALSPIGKSLGLENLPFLFHYTSQARAMGLAHHPNSYGETNALALPMLIYMFGATRGWLKVLAALSIPIAMYAVFLSGSRAALAGGAVLAVASFASLAISTKRIQTGALLLAMVLTPLAIVTAPKILKASRFFSESGELSNAARFANLEEGIDLFEKNPLFGTGVGSWLGSPVPLILLTSGGVLYLIVFYGCLARPLVVRPRSFSKAFVSILVISAVGVLGIGLLNNGITERFLYWPFAALFALSLEHYPRTNENGRRTGGVARGQWNTKFGPKNLKSSLRSSAPSGIVKYRW
ncbi:O-antigen ligase family protein [Mycolicibacterium sp.]|uniref:O-antigen ligase family protein n=1 Tax=Mycolicibacterium sp. TaxID=2320850 RepID=UPI0037C8D4B3